MSKIFQSPTHHCMIKLMCLNVGNENYLTYTQTHFVATI